MTCKDWWGLVLATKIKKNILIEITPKRVIGQRPSGATDILLYTHVQL